MNRKNTRIAAMVAAALAAPLAVVGLTTASAGAEAGVAPSASVPPPPVECHRRLEVTDVTLTEGTSTTWPPATRQATVWVTSTGCLRPGTVDWNTVQSTANQYDFGLDRGAITFVSGQSVAKAVVTLVNKDGSPGPDEYYWIRLVNPSSGVVIDDAYGRVTLLDDDPMCVPPLTLPEGYPSWHCME